MRRRRPRRIEADEDIGDDSLSVACLTRRNTGAVLARLASSYEAVPRGD